MEDWWAVQSSKSMSLELLHRYLCIGMAHSSFLHLLWRVCNFFKSQLEWVCTSGGPNNTKLDAWLLKEEAPRRAKVTRVAIWNAIQVPTSDNVLQTPCAVFHFLFHVWSRYYTLSCGCMYHLSCLVQSMLESPKCILCKKDISKKLYMTFNMGGDYDRLVPNPSGVSLGDLGLSL